MSENSTVSQLGLFLTVVVMVTLVGGQAVGQPVLLSYVETESMSPTMEPGDGFVPVPTQVAGPVTEGDVVVFEAEELHGGGLTTHRVVGETERGYITKGDGNPFTDQDNVEPPVTEPQIVATALELNGRVVVIPEFGTVIEAVQSVLETAGQQVSGQVGAESDIGPRGVAVAVFVTSLLWYVIDDGETGASIDRDRSRETGTNTRLVVAGCGVLLVCVATVAMVVPGGTHEYGIVSASFDSERPDVIPQGETGEIAYPVDNQGVVPVVAYLEPESEGVTVEPTRVGVGPRRVENATVTLQAPPETGYYRRFVAEHRYLAVLPQPILDGLYAMHPWAPIIGIDSLLGGGCYLLGRRLLGGRLRDRSRRREPGFRATLRRLKGMVDGEKGSNN